MRACVSRYLRYLIFVTCAIFSQANFIFDNPYCNLSSCKAKGEVIYRHYHTMCIHPDDKPSPKCGENAVSIEYYPEEIDEIVTWHNKIRSKVALGHMPVNSGEYEVRFLAEDDFYTSKNMRALPPASDMHSLSWNYELAIIARRAAMQCDPNLSECLNTFWSDQVGSITLVEPIDSINGSLPLDNYFDGNMFNLRTNFRDDEGRSFDEIEMMKNELQIIWGPARDVGCGRVAHRDNSGVEKVTMVCLYDKGGTRLGLAYRNGLPCSQCPSDAGCVPEFGLCSRGVSWGSEKARFYLFLLLVIFGIYLLFRKSEGSDM